MSKDTNNEVSKKTNILPQITKTGRKKLTKEERSSERITLLLTPLELKCFESHKPHSKIPNGLFLKDYLINKTNFLNK